MDFAKCRFCIISHKLGTKHLYSEKHRKRVKLIYRRFKRKVKSAKEDLYKIQIEPEVFENSKTFWCFFCEDEFPKHLHSSGATIKSWAFIQHVSQESHFANVDKFWEEQRIKDQSTNSYCISREAFETFKVQAVEKLQQYLLEKEQHLKEKVNTLKAQEETRKINTREAIEDNYDRTSQKCFYEDAEDTHMPKLKGIMTIAAKAEGLTCISIPNINRNKGNIHSGATPPWLRNDAQTKDTIGPSLDDYEKHLEYERKKKLPAGRVGASNDETDYGQHWMPSFGRVWSKNSRQNQRKWSMKQGYMVDQTTKEVHTHRTDSSIDHDSYNFKNNDLSCEYNNSPYSNKEYRINQDVNYPLKDEEKIIHEPSVRTGTSSHNQLKKLQPSDHEDSPVNKYKKHCHQEGVTGVKPYSSKTDGGLYHRKTSANLTKQRITIASNLL